tara:strand:+ start:10241 stop:11860 length:1620 start_codon:yes stop_codon:yes gene_type:complete
MRGKYVQYFTKDAAKLLALAGHELYNFYLYIKHRPFLLLLLAILITVTYSVKLFHYDYSIDTGRALYDYSGILASWESIYRLGLVLLKDVLFPAGLNIFFANSLTFIALYISTIIFIYMAHRIVGTISGGLYLEILAASLFVTSPIIIEQLNFTLQSFEVALGTILTLLGSGMVLVGYFKRSAIATLAAVLLWSFSAAIYQSFVPFMIVLGVFWVALLLLSSKKVSFYRLAMTYIGVLIVSLVIYGTAIYIFEILHTGGTVDANSGSYLSSQVVWVQSALEAFYRIGGYIKMVILGEGRFYNILPALLSTLAVVGIILAKKPWVWKVQMVLLVGGLYIAIFSLVILLGQPEEVRARYPAQPIFLAMIVYLSYILMPYRYMRITILSLALLFSFAQVRVTTNLQSIENVKYTREQAMARDIINRADRLGVNGQYEQYKLIVIGDWKDRDALAIREPGMMIGVSHFEGGSQRVTELFNAMGYSFSFGGGIGTNPAQHKQVCLANIDSIRKMPIYPSDGGVKVVDNHVIIKLIDLPDPSVNC